jgi:tRNA(fMet)-specific endonuclease VapC
MSRYILDTDHVTLHQHNHPLVVARIQACAPDELAVTVVTIEEQMRGRLAQIGRRGADLTLAYAQLRATADYFYEWDIIFTGRQFDRKCGRIHG